MSKYSKPLGSNGIPTKEWNLDVPSSYEPHRAFRYQVTMPEEFSIMAEAVQEINLPIVKFGWLGKKYTLLSLKILNFIGGSGLLHVHHNAGMKNFDIVIDQLDPSNVSVIRWRIKCSKINSIEYGNLSYSDDGMHYFFMEFKVKKITQEFEKQI
jgi:hypothetical protein